MLRAPARPHNSLENLATDKGRTIGYIFVWGPKHTLHRSNQLSYMQRPVVELQPQVHGHISTRENAVLSGYITTLKNKQKLDVSSFCFVGI